MANYILISGTTLSREYSNFPLLDFPRAPSGTVPCMTYEFLNGKAPRTEKFRAAVSPYALPELEAALFRKHSLDEVVIAHEDCLDDSSSRIRKLSASIRWTRPALATG